MIEFETERVSLPSLDYAKVRKWIAVVAEKYGYSVGRLNYLFCDDEYILKINREYLKHDYYTDIITFDYTGNRKRLSGDIFISLDTVASNAQELGESNINELLRVIIHGVLHLCGIDDKGPGEREIMEMHENEALKLYLDEI